MTESEILYRCGKIYFLPGYDDRAIIHDAAEMGAELFLAVWSPSWCSAGLRTRSIYLLKVAEGLDDPAFVAAVEALHVVWLEERAYLCETSPPPVDVYHLTAKDGVVAGQILKRPPPSVAVGGGAMRRSSASCGLGRVALRRVGEDPMGLDGSKAR